MSGAVWALIAGIGFGIFQALNRRAVYGMEVYLATFLQLFISALVLGGVTLATVDLSLIQDMPLSAWINFALAGFIHFFLGWTFMNASQKKIGAARTSPLIGTTPLFGAAVGALTQDEFPDLLSWIGILIIVFGVYLVSRGNLRAASGKNIEGASLGWRGSIFALSAALSWSVSPIFIRAGLAEVPYPLLGVTIGMFASAIAYGLPLLTRLNRNPFRGVTKDALTFKIIAGVLVGLSTWTRWIALDLTSVAAVLAITMIATPVVLILSPLVMDKKIEKITSMLIIGTIFIVGGALMLVLIP